MALGPWPRTCSGRHPHSRISGSGVPSATVTRRAGCAAGSYNATRRALWTRPDEDPVPFRSHIVELEDGSQWQVFPGDLDLTLASRPETDLAVAAADDDVASHALVGGGVRVRVIPASESWPVREVKDALKQG